jgi:hypothetical protein
MKSPVAVKLLSGAEVRVRRISVEPMLASQLAGGAPGRRWPAVLVVKGALIVDRSGIAVIDPADIVSVTPGRWEEAILVVLPEAEKAAALGPASDEAFLDAVRRTAPQLNALARATLEAVRSRGVPGHLSEERGRWVNRPLNSFSLRIQPRAGNLQFTIYGTPGSHDAGSFLKKDQHSYSRGWIESEKDAKRFAKLAVESHRRRGG